MFCQLSSAHCREMPVSNLCETLLENLFLVERAYFRCTNELGKFLPRSVDLNKSGAIAVCICKCIRSWKLAKASFYYYFGLTLRSAPVCAGAQNGLIGQICPCMCRRAKWLDWSGTPQRTRPINIVRLVRLARAHDNTLGDFVEPNCSVTGQSPRVIKRSISFRKVQPAL
jgi:hypothetical protein